MTQLFRLQTAEIAMKDILARLILETIYEIGRSNLSPKMSTVLTSQLFGDERVAQKFLIVVRRGGFDLAARSLGLSSDALRKEIRQLEVRLQMQLFHVTNDRVRLTDEGEELYQLAEEFFSKYSFTDLYGESFSDLVLSIPTILLEGFLYRELISALRKHSGVKVSLTDDEPESQQGADVVVWLQEPSRYNNIHRKLTKTRHLSTLSFSLYTKEHRLRGREAPEKLSDLDHYMTVQYSGYEQYACFSQWNNYIAQRSHSSIYTESPQAQWHMVRWASCVGLLPDAATYLDSGVTLLPPLLDMRMELEVWIGLSAQSMNDREANIIAERLSRAFK